MTLKPKKLKEGSEGERGAKERNYCVSRSGRRQGDLVTQDKVTQGKVTQDKVTQDKVTQGKVTQGTVTHPLYIPPLWQLCPRPSHGDGGTGGAGICTMLN